MADKTEHNDVVETAASTSAALAEGVRMTPEMRYYYRNREEKIAKDLA